LERGAERGGDKGGGGGLGGSPAKRGGGLAGRGGGDPPEAFTEAFTNASTEDGAKTGTGDDAIAGDEAGAEAGTEAAVDGGFAWKFLRASTSSDMSSLPFPVLLSFSEESLSTTVRKSDMLSVKSPDVFPPTSPLMSDSLTPTVSIFPSHSLFACLRYFATPRDDFRGRTLEHFFSCPGELSGEDDDDDIED